MNRYILGSVLCLSLVLTGCDAREPQRQFQTVGTIEAPLEGEVTIEIENFRFSPEAIVIRRGTVITVTNRDTAGQSVRSNDKTLDTGILGQGESATLIPADLGTFTYSSEPYPNMVGQITVVQ